MSLHGLIRCLVHPRPLVQHVRHSHRLAVSKPLVELEGDEVARVIWRLVKERLVLPYLDINILHHDLSLANRDATRDQVTHDAAKAILQHGAGVKCATISPTPNQVVQYNLKAMWPSPNATIRNTVGGTIFREPILASNIPQYIPGWTSPICVARHAHGDQYTAVDMVAPRYGKAKLVWEPKEGERREWRIQNFRRGGGVLMAMYNTDQSIRDFARSCFSMAITKGWPLYLGTKSSILKSYDGRFRQIFEEVNEEFREAMAEAGVQYHHLLIDAMVGHALKSHGGFVWAAKNYDGDVQSEFVAQAFGSSSMMWSVQMSGDGLVAVAETMHGSLGKEYRKYVEVGRELDCNPMATIFAWTGGLSHLAKLEGNHSLKEFCRQLEVASVAVVEQGHMTRDLAGAVHGLVNVKEGDFVTTEKFVQRVGEQLDNTWVVKQDNIQSVN